MAIEFIGSLASAALRGASPAPAVLSSALATDPEYPARLAGLHEESGFDRLLVGQSSSSPDGFSVANQVLTTTSRLAVLLAHRPGVVAPTVAARQYATLEAFHPGRVAMQVITGGDGADQARDGDFADKAARYRRSDEFLRVVKLTWSSPEPFDFDGEFYRVAGGWSAVRPRGGRLPVYLAGTSADAVRAGARHADVYAFLAESPAAIAARIAEVRAAAAARGRSPRFAVSLRPIAAATDRAAWDRAHRILDAALGRAAAAATWPHASERSLRLCAPVSNAAAGAGNPAALVGSYEQVAESLLDYVAIGVSTLLIRGYDPEADVAGYARVIRLVRERAADHRALRRVS
jgi:alkanesulfonate monooxygenase